MICWKPAPDKGFQPIRGLGDALQLVGKIASRGRRRKGFAVLVVNRNGFFDYLAQLGKNGLLVRAVAAGMNQPGGAADVATVFL